MINKVRDSQLAAGFALLIIIFVALAFNSDPFFLWVYERHQNQASWFIRPLFLVPFCYFAYMHSLAGIMGTIFLLLTSMFWFAAPSDVPDNIKQFLQFEKDWLQENWTFAKVFLASLVPLSFMLLALAFWKRSLYSGLSVLVLMATGKIVWAVDGAGNAGTSIIFPATIGLLICCLLVLFGFQKLNNRH
ncbi:hypothetical protein [Dyadobacter alkalitolerans]|uniref:hypothetical protein n=1 Tax=Dyadobacter alkalitolerans TaxID=492736 RepID=UPI0004118C65|nr:hypothetical protein [Dyadobacter alkalitolerans]